MQQKRFKLAAIAGLALVYFLAGKLGLSLAFLNSSATAVWPPTGIALAALLLFGPWLWPGVFLGAFLVNVTTNGSVLMSAGMATGNALEAIVGAVLVRRFAGGCGAFDCGNDVFRYIGLVALSAAISATFGVTSLYLGEPANLRYPGEVWLTWWLGDAVSAMILTPLLVIWGQKGKLRLSSTQRWEAGLLLVLMFLAGQIVFGGWLPESLKNHPLAFTVLPFFLWGAFRFGKHGAITAAFMLASIAIGGTLRGFGPFIRSSPNESLLLLQAFMGVMTSTALVLAAVLAERKRAEEKITSSEKNFRLLAENIREIIYMSNLREPYLFYVSPAYEEIWARSCESLHADPRSFVESVHPEDRPLLTSAIKRQLAGLRTEEEYRIVRPDGSIRWIRDRAFPILDAAGSIFAVTGIAEDMTGRRRGEKLKGAFSDLGHSLNTATSYRDAARIITDIAEDLFHWDACTFDAFSSKPPLVTTVVVDTIHGQKTEVPPVLDGKLSPRALQVIANGPSLVLRSEPIRMPPDAIPIGDKSRLSASIMSVPIRHSKKPLGVLSLHSYTPNAYTQEDLNTLQALADHCAGALERIRAEEEVARLNLDLKLRLDELQKMFDLLPVAIGIAADPACKRIAINPEFGRILGLPPGANASKSAPPEEQPASFKVVQGTREVPADELPMQMAAASGIEIRNWQADVVRADGTVVNELGYATPLFDADGKIRGAIGAFIDITERKQSEEALRASEERYRMLFERNPMPMWVRDEQTLAFLAVNEAAVRHYGYSREEFLSMTIKDLRPAEDVPAFLKFLEEHSLPVQTSEWRLRRKDGSLVHAEMTSHAIQFDGRPARLVLAHDITDRKLAEQTMRELNLELEERVHQRTAELETLNRELEAFCYSVSHDLRAPLRAVVGFSQAVLDEYGDKLDDSAREYLRRTYEGGRRMSQLIEDLLHLSRVSRSEMRHEEVDLGALGQEIVGGLRELEPQRDVEFVAGSSLLAPGDPRLLRIALENMLGNAWKFTSKRASARIELGALEQNSHPTYFVRDNGAGFGMEYAAKLFGVFQRLHTNDEFQGTGIGLATVQRIIHRHGGRIWAEGGIDRGATFYFTLADK